MTKPVGVVLVSHSAELVAGLLALIRQLAADAVPLAAAGGTEQGGIGTSYDLVLAAIDDADRGGGIVVLPDLGSSVLTARAVLADHPRPGVVLVDAPFVEGAVAAAVTAATGADLDTVVGAAKEARDIPKL
jgi:phosphoenolpyruvate---glycerone phosphotransferase subunit DhaM